MVRYSPVCTILKVQPLLNQINFKNQSYNEKFNSKKCQFFARAKN